MVWPFLGWVASGFLLGSLPLAVWIGRVPLGIDVRNYGDGNPGAGNLWRAAGWRWGLVGVVVEIAKSALPTFSSTVWGGLQGWSLAAVALAPVLGHAFSPWLRFRGGKAIACVFGAWLGLLGPVGIIALAVSLGVMYAWQTSDAWTVVMGMIAFLGFLLVRGESLSILGVWCGCALVLVFKHRHELEWPLHTRRWLVARRNS